MKQLTWFAVFLGMLSVVATANAFDDPYGDGKDVIFDQNFVESTENYVPGSPIFIGSNANDWGTTWLKARQGRQLVLDSVTGKWRAPGMRGQQFNIYQLCSFEKYEKEKVKGLNWFPLHFYTAESWVVTRPGGGHAIFVK